MNRTALAFGVGASLILAAGAANAAGSCGAEVAELENILAQLQSKSAAATQSSTSMIPVHPPTTMSAPISPASQPTTRVAP